MRFTVKHLLFSLLSWLFMMGSLILPVHASSVSSNSMFMKDSLRRRSIHKQHQESFSKLSLSERFVDGYKGANQTKPNSVKNIKLSHEVFGWLPYWNETQGDRLNYNLLSTLAYFSYEINPRSGLPKTIHQWETAKAIDSALAHDVSVLLTITNFGEEENRLFLKNVKAQDALIDRTIAMLEKRSAHGISVDFELIPNALKNELTAFLVKYKKALLLADSDYKLFLTVPASYGYGAFDLTALEPHIDRFVIMGYDYYGSFSRNAGPIAPLESGNIWNKLNLNKTVDYYTGAVAGAKILLALPFYGASYRTDSELRGASFNKFFGYKSYDQLKVEKRADSMYDEVSQTAWQNRSVGEGLFSQNWFDDARSMEAKLKLIKDKKLGGMGIWALGYNTAYPDLWSAVERSFSTVKSDPVIKPKPKKNFLSWLLGLKEKFLKKLKHLFKSMSTQEIVMFSSLVLVVIALCLGFVVTILKKEGRKLLLGTTKGVLIFYVVFSVCLVLLMRKMNVINSSLMSWVIAFILGGAVSFSFLKLIMLRQQNRP